MKKKYLAIFAIILILAVFSRFLSLDLRPVHHDEGMLSYFAWQLAQGGGYTYTPQIHGPILFYLQALFFKLLGTGDAVVRAVPALFGTILVALPLFFWRKLGIRRAIAVSFLFLTSPLLVYFSRFLVHSALVIVANFLIVLLIWLFCKSLRPLYLYLLAVFLAIAFGISETSYIFTATMVLYLPIFRLFYPKQFYSLWKKLKRFVLVNYLDLVSAFLLFVLLWILIYSVGLTSSTSLIRSLPNPFSYDSGLGFWLAQHEKRLGNQPWYYYFILLVVYEPIILLGTVLAAVQAVKRRSGGLFCLVVFLAVANFAAYSFAGEKFPWLVLPTLVLFAFAAGIYIGDNYQKLKLVPKTILFLLVAFSLFNVYRLNYLDPADTRELATYVQTPNSFRQIVSKVNAVCRYQDNNCVLIDPNISWPLSWEFRQYGRLDNLDLPQTVSEKTKFIFADLQKAEKFNNNGFLAKQVQLRDWWVPPVCRQFDCALKFINYFIYREIWGSKGGYEIMVLSRDSLDIK